MANYRIAITTTGSAGSATGSATTDVPVRGLLMGVKIDYHASAPATTDVTIAEAGVFGRTITTRSNSATDGFLYPAVQLTDSSGAAISGSYNPVYISGEYLTISVAQCDALTNAVVLWLQTLE